MVVYDCSPVGSFLSELTLFKADDVFNPWVDNCRRSDASESSGIRRKNLVQVLEACVEAELVDLWIGRDLGWRGGRRTGVPLVDEMTLQSYGSSINAKPLFKATIDAPLKERTATEVETARSRVSRRVFFWNVFPYHPHQKENSLSNRNHSPAERDIGFQMLELILNLLPIEHIVAIGGDATKAIERMGLQCWPVRHPSYGGQKDFHSQVCQHYKIPAVKSPQEDLFACQQMGF